MNWLSRIFGKSESTALICPHCEREMEGDHDLDACAQKRMSRRYFFGVMGGAAAAVTVASKLPDLPAFEKRYLRPSMGAIGDWMDIQRIRNQYLSTEMITAEMLITLHRNLDMAAFIGDQWSEEQIQARSMRIGKTVTVRRPSANLLEVRFGS
jgi:hypothetical protein